MALHEPILSAATLPASPYRFEYPVVVIRTPLAPSSGSRPVSASPLRAGRVLFRLVRLLKSDFNFVVELRRQTFSLPTNQPVFTFCDMTDQSGGSSICKRCGQSCSLRTINSRSHLQMSAEPILCLSDRARRCPCADMKIHKAKGGAISLNRNRRPCARAAAPRTRQKTVHSFQGVDESLGISESLAARSGLSRAGFF